MGLVDKTLSKWIQVVIEGLLGIEIQFRNQLVLRLRFLACSHDLPALVIVKDFAKIFDQDALISDAGHVLECPDPILDLSQFI